MRIEGLHHVHLLGICGAGMASLAGLFQESGYRVTGSDQGVYPPASTLLEELGISAGDGYRPEHLDPAPDLVVVGNAIMRGNPELEAVLDRDIPYLSMPETLRWLWLGERRRVVVAGTHGKTTVTAIIAWILSRAGLEPGFLIGGTPLGLGRPFAVGLPGSPFVLEGDEYDTAFFDKGPKFLHYRPHILVLNSVEWDHVDIYPTEAAYRFAFERLAMLPPASGRVVVGGESPTAVEVSRRALCPVETFGLEGEHAWSAASIETSPEGTRFRLLHEGKEEAGVRFPWVGEYAVRNALAAWAACSHLGMGREDLLAGLASFPGVRKRMELRGEEGGVQVVDDFAHHPTAVREVVAAARVQFPGRRLWVAFEPRSWSCRRRLHQEAFPEAMAGADRVVFAPVFGGERLEPAERLDTAALAAALEAKGVPARAAASIDDVLNVLLEETEEGDVVLALSNGSFGGLHGRLLEGLRERTSRSGETE